MFAFISVLCCDVRNVVMNGKVVFSSVLASVDIREIGQYEVPICVSV